MKQPPRLAAHGILKVTKVRQHVKDKSLQLHQGLGPVQWPGQLGSIGLAKTFDTCANDGGPQFGMIVRRAQIRWLQRKAGPRLAVFGIKVPLAAHRFFGRVNQHFVAHTHVAVKRFHQPLGAARKKLGRFMALGVEMLAADALAGNGLLTRKHPQLLIQSMLVRVLVLELGGLVVINERCQVGRHRWQVGRVING